MDFNPEKRIFILDDDDTLVMGVVNRRTFHATEAGIVLNIAMRAQKDRQGIREQYGVSHPWMDEIFGSMDQDDVEYFQHIFDLLAQHGEFAEVDYMPGVE